MTSRRRARAGRSSPGGCSACVRTCRPSRRPITTPFVGRERELDGAPRCVRRSRCASASCCLATIVGPPGIGKSRLAREALRSLEKDARVVVGRCVAYGDGITYLPLADVVRDVAGADPEPALARAPGERRARRVAARLIPGAIGAARRAGLARGDRLGVPPALRDACRLRARSSSSSDDIHWAEPTLLDLLEYVARLLERRADPAPLPRPAGPLRRPPVLGCAPAAHALVSLSPLADERVRGADRRAAATSGEVTAASATGSSAPPRAIRCSSSRCSPCSPTTPTLRTRRSRRRSRRSSPPASTGSSRASARCCSAPRSRAGCSTAAPSPSSSPDRPTTGSAACFSPSRARSSSDPTARCTRATTPSASTTC